MILKILYAFLPISIALHFFHASPTLIFIAAALAIIPLAELMREGAGQVSLHVGPAVGGLLTITFGNATELILSILLLAAGNSPGLVKATISGSIISNSLLGLGLAIMVSIKHGERMSFAKDKAGLLTSMLLLSLIALTLPALFDYTERHFRAVPHPENLDESLSLAVSVVLILAYLVNVVYSIVTNKDPFEGDEEEGGPKWSKMKALGILLLATIGVALEAELISHSVEATAATFGLSPFFIGIVVLPLVGNAAEYFTAVHFARQGKIGMTMSIAVGASIQVALLAAPLLVIVSYFMGNPMNLVFSNPMELFAITAAGLSVNTIAQDGEVMWFEGVLLLAVYLLLCVSFFFLSP